MITFIGNIVADMLGKKIERIPPPGYLEAIDEIKLSTGGCSSNPAVVLARMGAKVRILGAVGDDNFGKFLLSELKLAGVNTDGVKILKGVRSSATIVCIYGSGERSFIHQSGASQAYTIKDVSWDLISTSKYLHFGGFFVLPNFMGEDAAHLFKKAKAKNLITSLDTAWDHSGQWLGALKPSLPYVDFLMTNRLEGHELTGENDPQRVAKVLRLAGARTVIIKLDKDGCYICNENISKSITSFAVPVVDSTGAGDAFAAGFILGLQNNLPIEDSCRFANLFGATAVTEIGATDAFKNKDAVKKFFKKNAPDLLAHLPA